MSTPHDTQVERASPIPRRVRLVALMVYFVALFVATHLPPRGGPPSENHLDKVLHFVAYAMLAWLLAWAIGPPTRMHWLKWSLALWLAVGVYGAVEEFFQPMVGRTCDWNDWWADLAGAGVGLLLYRLTSSAPVQT
jgi:VanZ family protein